MYQISPINWIFIFFMFFYLIFYIFYILIIFEFKCFSVKLMKKIYVK